MSEHTWVPIQRLESDSFGEIRIFTDYLVFNSDGTLKHFEREPAAGWKGEPKKVALTATNA